MCASIVGASHKCDLPPSRSKSLNANTISVTHEALRLRRSFHSPLAARLRAESTGLESIQT
jgi:hypothetical protein